MTKNTAQKNSEVIEMKELESESTTTALLLEKIEVLEERLANTELRYAEVLGELEYETARRKVYFRELALGRERLADELLLAKEAQCLLGVYRHEQLELTFAEEPRTLVPERVESIVEAKRSSYSVTYECLGGDPQFYYTPTVPDQHHALFLQMKSSASSAGQVYWDTGKGFNETQSSRFSVDQERVSSYLIPLSEYPIRALRFDPIDDQGTVEIFQLRIVPAKNCSHLLQSAGFHKLLDWQSGQQGELMHCVEPCCCLSGEQIPFCCKSVDHDPKVSLSFPQLGAGSKFLRVLLKASAGQRVQVYWNAFSDPDLGYSEDSSFSVPLKGYNKFYDYVIPLPESKVSRLRLDPIDTQGVFEIAKCEVWGAANHGLWGQIDTCLPLCWEGRNVIDWVSPIDTQRYAVCSTDTSLVFIPHDQSIRVHRLFSPLLDLEIQDDDALSMLCSHSRDMRLEVLCDYGDGFEQEKAVEEKSLACEEKEFIFPLATGRLRRLCVVVDLAYSDERMEIHSITLGRTNIR